jgi:hypothetical protein
MPLTTSSYILSLLWIITCYMFWTAGLQKQSLPDHSQRNILAYTYIRRLAVLRQTTIISPKPINKQCSSFIIGGVGLSPLGTAATSGLLYKPQMIDEDDCGAIGVMKIGRGNRSTRRKPASAPLCPPQIPHDQTRARTPDRRGGKPATNHLSYGAAIYVCNIYSDVYSLCSSVLKETELRLLFTHNGVKSFPSDVHSVSYWHQE